MIIHLGLPLPTVSCGLPADIEQATRLRKQEAEASHPLDLAPGGVCRAAPVTRNAGGLLHHRFTLTGTCTPAVCFLWHFPAGCPGWALPTTLPCGVRTFLDPVASAAITRPTRPRSGYGIDHVCRVAMREQLSQKHPRCPPHLGRSWNASLSTQSKTPPHMGWRGLRVRPAQARGGGATAPQPPAIRRSAAPFKRRRTSATSQFRCSPFLRERAQ